MIKKMIKMDLRKGFDRGFIKESLQLSKEILNSLNVGQNDLVIIDASNRNYDINIKTTNDFILDKIETMLNRSFDYFNGREVERFREILTFEIELFKVANVKDYLYEVTFNIWTKQETLSTGSGFANIDICVANLDNLLNQFNGEIKEFNLNKNQLDYLNELYEETTPLHQKLTNIDEYIMQDIQSSVDMVLSTYEQDNVEFNKELILQLLKEDNDYVSNLYLDNLNINQIDTNSLEIYLFDNTNKIVLNKYDYFERDYVEDDYELADII